MNSNHVVFDCGLTFEERLGKLAEVWIRDGRGSDHLVTGEAFFAVYSWHLQHWTDHDITWAEYAAAAYDAIGGSDGWSAMLRERAFCESCGDRYRLENIGMCTGCMRYTCYSCGGHGACAGVVV
ncbi:hypothetical protein [Streptomyces sp. L-9-10]|uniref:hypothetical protein n=1 Tax=unclassified Streptomyces TaxID=2593676 RepID=UPI00101BE289|nr:hypothetical protein [Streptomyces sp. L-9-10]